MVEIAKSELIVDKIEIQQDGRLNKEFGTGFIDESTKIIFDIWNLPSNSTIRILVFVFVVNWLEIIVAT